MGSIVKTDAGQFRAFIRRKGFKSKSKTFGNKTAAVAWLRNAEADTELVPVGKANPLSFSKVVERFGNAGLVRRDNAAPVDHWKAVFGDIPIPELDHARINAEKLALQQQKAKRRTPNGIIEQDRPLSNATVNRYMSALSAVMNFSIEHGLIDQHPMAGRKVRKLKEGPGRDRVLSNGEMMGLLAAAGDSKWPQLRLFLTFVMLTGCRKSEALNLKWSEVDLSNQVALLRTTKNGNARSLPLGADVRALLADASKVRALGNDYVFYNHKKPIERAKPEAPFNNALKAVGLYRDRADKLSWVGLHTMRHTFITRMVQSGVSVAQIQGISGHKSLSQVARYTHHDIQTGVALVDRVFGGKIVAGGKRG